MRNQHITSAMCWLVFDRLWKLIVCEKNYKTELAYFKPYGDETEAALCWW